MGTTIHPGSENLTEGAVWRLCVVVRDEAGLAIVGDPPVVTVTPPTGPDVTVTMTNAYGRGYLGTYVAAAPGRHLATAATLTHGTGYATAYVTAPVDAAGMPDLDAAAGYLGETSATDDEITDALDAEAAAQRGQCRVPAAYPADLRQALLRRVARNLAMRGIPLAVLQGDAEGGDSTVLPGRDPEVQRFEKPWRKLVMG